MWKIVTLAGIVGLVIFANTRSSCDTSELYEAFTDKVEAELRSPASAIHAPMGEALTMSESSNSSCFIIVTGYVDSQNGFGAMLRSKVEGLAKREDGKITASAIVWPN